MNQENNYYCRVCGYLYDEPTWDPVTEIPSHNICFCCGVEFGYEDSTIDSIRKYRQEWLNNKAKWFNRKRKPADWSLEKQLENIPSEYL
jgi:rubredoxin